MRRAVRSFATVVDSAGVKVAAVDNGEATTSVTFLVKGGSRFENKPGVAHALQNFAFKVRTVSFVLRRWLNAVAEHWQAFRTCNHPRGRALRRSVVYKSFEGAFGIHGGVPTG